jgi:hypothetical protein
MNEHEPSAFLQTIICFEIIFSGQKDRGRREPQSEILAARASYGMSSSISERTAIYSDVINAYKLRQKIVHEGRARLEPKDRTLMNQFRNLLERAIIREVSQTLK